MALHVVQMFEQHVGESLATGISQKMSESFQLVRIGR
jgi:hypothetical protein